TIPAAAPSADELVEDTPGNITAPATAAAGSSITITVDGLDNGTDVGVWLFSTPVSLGTHTVANGQVAVTVPADTAAGVDSVAVWTQDGLFGWDTITVTTDDGVAPSPTDTAPPASSPSPSDADKPGASTGKDDDAAT